MSPHFDCPGRTPTWIAGIFLCLLAASGLIGIVRSIPTSYASIPNKDAAAGNGATATTAGDTRGKGSRAPSAAAEAAMATPTRLRCPECGVIESIRQVVHSGKVGGQDAAGTRVAPSDSGGASAEAIATTTYETTVRFRDGRRTLFNEATARNWQSGNRVMVIGRPSAPND